MADELTFEQKIQRSEELVRESYFSSSVIDRLVQVRDARASDEGFLKSYRRTYIPREWFIRKDVYSDLVFKRFGSNISLSEKKYFIEEILKKKRDRTRVGTVDFETLKKFCLSVFESGTRPTVMLAPIGFFTRLHTDWRDDPDLQIRSMNNITISGHNFEISWSNKYIPFDEFVFIDKSFGEWVAKPSFKERLSVSISESDREAQLDLLVYTTLKFNILRMDRISILEITKQERART